ncbi:MAG: cell wall hydrolase [Rhizobiaceae bacterium]|nr:cell wall hydrolase [Rhizobiaceae bacterium]
MRTQRALGSYIFGVVFAGLAATGCTTTTKPPPTSKSSTGSIRPAKVTYNYTTKDRDCLKRAMYFESEHSDNKGYMAVGTVVMNRLTSGAYPDSICGIVSQQKQFAPGVMTRQVLPQADSDLEVAAAALLRGERNPDVKDAMFFHTEGLKFPYDNMHYVAYAGGNAFYEKRDQDGELETPAPLPGYEVAMNYVPSQTMIQSAPFPVLLPAADQIPVVTPDVTTAAIPLPTATATVPPPISMPVTLPTSTIAVPIPRPAIDNAVFTSSIVKAGG